MKAKPEKEKNTVVREGEHLIGSFIGNADGPTLIAIGGIHGNEPSGAQAVKDVAEKLPQLADRIDGRVFLLAGNTRALNRQVRFIDCDLNRSWTPANMSSSGVRALECLSEGRELHELDELLDQILITARAEVYILDLHSTSASGLPFATVGDTLRNRKFAMGLPVTILLGIEEQLEGTMLEYFNNAGAVTLGFEGGSHLSPETVDNHAALIWLSLINADILSRSDVPDYDEMYRRLANGRRGARVVEVRYRKAIDPEDGFEMNPGFNNFDPILKDQVLAHEKHGPVRAVESGMILMPLYQKLGEDGFFIGRAVAPFWLRISSILRQMRVQNIVGWLPGVARDPNDHETLIVNTSLARFFPLQVFHLLGYRRRRWERKKLVVSRRRHDYVSPFENRRK